MEKHDLVVIGGGPGGYPAAIRAAQLGADVALVEREAPGGTCLNWGCIPTKTLLASSGLYWEMRHGADMGVKCGELQVDYAAMTARKDRVVEKLRAGIGQLLRANRIRFYEGTARLLDRRHVAVRAPDGGELKLEAGHIVVATGTVSAMPAGLPDHPAVFDSRAFLALTELPESMIVMGGGIIGCELACLAAQLGSKVTVVEMLEDILPMLDRDVRLELRRNMERRLGIKIIAGCRLEKIKALKSGISAQAGGEKLKAAGLLVAVGRKPCSGGLGLEAAGCVLDERGYVQVDENCRTRAANIFAVGDVNGGPQLAHAATAQGLRAAGVIRGIEVGDRRPLVPACIFTAPEIGAVGLTEQQAREESREVLIGKFSFAALGKALAANTAAGFVKWIADGATRRLLGAQAIGAHATELLAEATLAIENELTLNEVAATVHAHPTMAEAWMEAAHAALGHCIHAPPVRQRGART